MNKKIVGLMGVVIVVLVLIIVGFSYNLRQYYPITGYSIVYLANGELYIGKLSLYPRWKLESAYLLQTIKTNVTEPGPNKTVVSSVKTSYQLVPVNGAIWSPQVLYINSKQVMYYGPVQDNSQVAQSLKDKKK